MNTILAVAIGGAAGSVARYLPASRVGHWFGTEFPWGMVAVSIIYCTIYGALIEVFALYERGAVLEAALYVLASVVLSILGVFAGFHLFRTLLS